MTIPEHVHKLVSEKGISLLEAINLERFSAVNCVYPWASQKLASVQNLTIGQTADKVQEGLRDRDQHNGTDFYAYIPREQIVAYIMAENEFIERMESFDPSDESIDAFDYFLNDLHPDVLHDTQRAIFGLSPRN